MCNTHVVDYKNNFELKCIGLVIFIHSKGTRIYLMELTSIHFTKYSDFVYNSESAFNFGNKFKLTNGVEEGNVT